MGPLGLQVRLRRSTFRYARGSGEIKMCSESRAASASGTSPERLSLRWSPVTVPVFGYDALTGLTVVHPSAGRHCGDRNLAGDTDLVRAMSRSRKRTA